MGCVHRTFSKKKCAIVPYTLFLHSYTTLHRFIGGVCVMGGFAGGFALIVVLFILLIVAGAGGFATPGY